MFSKFRFFFVMANVSVLIMAAYVLGNVSGKAESDRRNQVIIQRLSSEIIIATAPKISYDDVLTPKDALVKYSDEQLCMAFNIFHESRNQPRAGRVMVGQVTKNRTGSRRSWGSVCDTVFADWQFSWTHEKPYIDLAKPKEREALRDALVLSEKILRNQEPDASRGAMHYYNPTKATPFWRDAYVKIGMVGDHMFLK